MVFQLKISRPLLRNTTKGRARKPDTEEPVGDEIDTATRDALTKDTGASRLLPHTADEARNITAGLLSHGTCDGEEFRVLLLALFQTPDPETGNVRAADHWLHTPVAWIRFHHTARRELYFLMRLDQTILTWDT